MDREVITAESTRGRHGIEAVMQDTGWDPADLERFPPAWERLLLVDGAPVSFALVAPDREWQLPAGSVTHAFLDGVATRRDRRRQGHFRFLMEHTFEALRRAGVPAMLTHGPHEYYRAIGFDVYAHNYGIFTTPEQIERRLGSGGDETGPEWFTVEPRHVQKDLLLVVRLQARGYADGRRALRRAAALARREGKARILFEAPCTEDGDFLTAPFAVLARACGARCCLQGAEPAGTSVGHGDWIRVLDAAGYMKDMVRAHGTGEGALPSAAVAFGTEAGAVTIQAAADGLRVLEGMAPGAVAVLWPSCALAQLATGYLPAEALAAIHGTPLPGDVVSLLAAVFPPRWRFARDESWTYGAR